MKGEHNRVADPPQEQLEEVSKKRALSFVVPICVMHPSRGAAWLGLEGSQKVMGPGKVGFTHPLEQELGSSGNVLEPSPCHALAHTHTHALTHRHICSTICTHRDTYTTLHMHTLRKHTCTHASMHIHVDMCRHKRHMHVYTCCIQIERNICTERHVYTGIPTCTQTHKCTHTCTGAR